MWRNNMARMKKLLNEAVQKKLSMLYEDDSRPMSPQEYMAQLAASKRKPTSGETPPEPPTQRTFINRVKFIDPETGQMSMKYVEDPDAVTGTRDTFSTRRGAAKTKPIPGGAATMSPEEYEKAIEDTKKELGAWVEKQRRGTPAQNLGKNTPKKEIDPNAPPVDDTTGLDVDDISQHTPTSRKRSTDDEEDTSGFDIDKVRGGRAGDDPLRNLYENVENRMSTHRLNVVLAELAQHLDKSQEKKLAEIFVELDMLAKGMNKIPYSIFTHDDWKMLKAVYISKVKEMQDELEKLQKNKKNVDFHKVMKVLEFMLTC
jgi:hypothetical protein